MKHKGLCTSLITFFLVSTTLSEVHAAGCVATRGTDFHGFMEPQNVEQSPVILDSFFTNKPVKFEAAVSYRHFRSDKTFVGKKEQKQIDREGSNFINTSDFIDLDLTYHVDNRNNITLTIPTAVQNRSQVVRANDINQTILTRYTTQTAGLADIRVVARRWILDPKAADKYNVLLGLGVDIPTGKADARDIFISFDSSNGKLLAHSRPVDQSIQLGDDGWGFIIDLYSYYAITPDLTTYVSGTYTITQQEKNNVKSISPNPFEAVNSIADNYTYRVGVDYLISATNNVKASLGVRQAGVPVHDLVGGSDGFRRPGYDISIEPGLSFAVDSWSFNLSTPITTERNSQRSVADKQQSKMLNIHTHGAASFADYEVIMAMAKKF